MGQYLPVLALGVLAFVFKFVAAVDAEQNVRNEAP